VSFSDVVPDKRSAIRDPLPQEDVVAHGVGHSASQIDSAEWVLAFARTTSGYASSTASAPFTASAESVTVLSSDAACTLTFSAKNRASVT
jgi:hypothetical protein